MRGPRLFEPSVTPGTSLHRGGTVVSEDEELLGVEDPGRASARALLRGVFLIFLVSLVAVAVPATLQAENAGATGVAREGRDPIGDRAPTAGEEDTPGARALRAVAEPFRALRTFRAEFVQSQEWIGSDEPTYYRGELFIRRPGQFRIEYSDPEGHLQVSDGVRVWTYVPENEQVLVAKLPEGLENNDLLGRILQESEAEPEVEQVQLDGQVVEVITLRPPPDLELREVRLWTGIASSEILQYELTEASGNRMTYRLTRTWENPELKEDLFRFEAPDGIPVVEVGTQ